MTSKNIFAAPEQFIDEHIELVPLYPCTDLSAPQLFHALPQIGALKAQLCARLNTALMDKATPSNGTYRFYVEDYHPLSRDLFVFKFVFHPPNVSLVPQDEYEQRFAGSPVGAFHLRPDLSFNSYCIESAHQQCFDVARSIVSTLLEILNHSMPNGAYITELTQNRKQFLNYLRKLAATLDDPIYLNYLLHRPAQLEVLEPAVETTKWKKPRRGSWER